MLAPRPWLLLSMLVVAIAVVSSLVAAPAVGGKSPEGAGAHLPRRVQVDVRVVTLPPGATRAQALQALAAAPWRKPPVDFGFMQDHVWIHLRASGNSQPTANQVGPTHYLVAASPIVSRLEYWAGPPRMARGVPLKLGAQLPFAQRSVHQHRLVIPLELGPTGSEALLRVASRTSISLPLRVVSASAFHREDRDRRVAYGVYFGLFIFAALYHVFLLLSTRDRSYLFYIVAQILIVAFQANQAGFLFEYFWPTAPEWNTRFNVVSPMFSVSFNCLFTATFLQTSIRRTWIGRLLGLAALGATIIGVAAAFWGAGYGMLARASAGWAALASVLLLGAGISRAREGFRPAWLLVLAFTLFYAGTFAVAAFKLGALPNLWIIRFGLQIGSLSEVFLLALALGDRLNTLQREKQALESENRVRSIELERVQLEVQAAQRIQQRLIPQAPPQMPGFRIGAGYVPMHDVGGDFYDFYRVSDTVLGVFIADVSGHGISAALIASMLKVASREQMGVLGRPEIFMRNINRSMLQDDGGDFVTAMTIILDLDRKQLLLANAGHPPLYVFGRDGSLTLHHPAGKILGIFTDFEVDVLTAPIQGGDRLVLITDGIIESTNHRGEMYAEARFLDYMRGAGSELDPEPAAHGLLAEIESWTGGRRELSDDLTVVVIDVVA